MPFEITTTCRFAAQHQLRMYDGSLEELHGHEWVVNVTVSAAKLDEIGVVMDFHDLERRIDEVVAPMRGRRLNDMAAFGRLNPSAENVAWHIGQALELPPPLKLLAVQVWETPENSATYRP